MDTVNVLSDAYLATRDEIAKAPEVLKEGMPLAEDSPFKFQAWKEAWESEVVPLARDVSPPTNSSGVMMTISHTALTIDPLLLEECDRIWEMSGDSLPPCPYEVSKLSLARYQVITWRQIKRYYKDEAKRNQMGYQ